MERKQDPCTSGPACTATMRADSAMAAAVGAGYHSTRSASRLWPAAVSHTADAGALNRPVVVNEAFMRVVGKGNLPFGALAFPTRCSEAAKRELGPGVRRSSARFHRFLERSARLE